MANRYPVRWLLTDERMPDLWDALRRVPPGSGVIFRHHATPAAERLSMFRRVRRIARARGLLLIAANPPLPVAVHGRVRGATTWPAHNRAQAIAGWKAGACLLLVSPVYPTRSHPRAKALGPVHAVRIARGLGLPIIALGGMTERRWRRHHALFDGWAGIDAFSRD